MTHRRSLLTRIRNRRSHALRRRRFARAVEHVHGAGFVVPQGTVLASILVRDSGNSLDAVKDLSVADALGTFRHNNISTVDSYDYHSDQIEFSALLTDNRLTQDAPKFKFFGEACCPNKHPLVFNSAATVPALQGKGIILKSAAYEAALP